MFRTDFDITDADYTTVVEPHNTAVDKYVRENFLYEFIAFYIANGYELNALWEGSLSAHCNGALEALSNLSLINEKELDNVKSILKNKYNLVSISEEPLIFSTKKEPSI